MGEELYRIEELCTIGWEVVASNLTRTEASERVKSLMDEGYSLNRLKIIREK